MVKSRSLGTRTLAAIMSFVMAFTLMPFPAYAAENSPTGGGASSEPLAPGAIMLAQAIDPATGYAGGEGTEESPYQIANAAQFVYFRNQVNAGNDADKYFKLTSDIDLSDDTSWTPIGASTSNSFKGDFNGNGHSIKNLTINAGANKYYALFGYVGGTAKLHDFIIDSGSIAGAAEGLAAVVGSTATTNDSITLSNIGNKVNVTNTSTSGNTAGILAKGTSVVAISGCFNTGDISSNGGANVAGIVGGTSTTKQATITSCYNVGSINTTKTSPQCIGGIGGNAGGANTTNQNILYLTIVNCYNAGAIQWSGTAGSVGSLTGKYPKSESSGNYYLSGTTTQNETDCDYVCSCKNSSDSYASAIATKANSADELRNGVRTGGFVGVWAESALTSDGRGPKLAWEVSETAATHTITYYNLNEKDWDGTAGAATYSEGTAFTLPTNVTRSGYVFAGWYNADGTDGNWGDKVTTISADSKSNVTVYARWVAESAAATVTYVYDNDTEPGTNEIKVAKGDTITEPTAPTKNGYVFEGWYIADDTSATYTKGMKRCDFPTNVTDNLRLVAHWDTPITLQISPTPTTATITLKDLTTEETFTGSTVSNFIQFDNLFKSHPYKASGTANHYADKEETYDLSNETGPTVQKSFTMSKASHSITYENLKGATPPTTTSYLEDKGTVTLQSPTDIPDGYTFAGWYPTDGTNNDNWGTQVTEITTSDTDDKTFYAKWNLTEYNITYNLNDGTNAAGNPATYTVETDTITLANATKENYAFKGWFDQDGSSSGNWGDQVTKIEKGSTGNVSLYAQWGDKVDISNDKNTITVKKLDDTYGCTGSALAINPSVSLSSGDKTKLTKGTDYTFTVYTTRTDDGSGSYTYSNEVAEVKDKGTYYGVITGIGNYAGTYVKEFRVVDYLTVYVQKGSADPVVKKAYDATAFATLVDTAKQDPVSVNFQESKAWKVSTGKQYIEVNALLENAGALADWKTDGATLEYGSANFKPTYAQVYGEDAPAYNFYPNATKDGYVSDADLAGATPAPFVLALSEYSDPIGSNQTAGDLASSFVTDNKLNANNAPRMLIGTTEAEFKAGSGTTVAGNRLWSNVNTITVKVPAIDITGGTVTKNFDDSYGYTGNPISLSNITVQLADGKTKVNLSADDYDVVFYNAEGAQLDSAPSAKGNYTATVTGKGAYTGSITKSFKIAPYLTVYTQEGRAGDKVAKNAYEDRAALEALVPTVEQDVVSAIYNGTNVITTTKYIPIESLLTDAGVLDSWKSDGSILNYGSKQYQPTYQSTQDTPTYFYPSATTDSYNVDSSSNKAASPLVLALLDNVGAIGKDGSTAGDVVNTIKQNVDTENTPRMVVGTTEADAAARGGATYAGNRIWRGVNEIVVITVADLTGAAEISGVEDKTYNGEGKEQDGLVVTYKGATLTKGTDYTVSYANNTDAGKATVTVTGTGTYKGSVSKDFTIAPISLKSAKVTTDPASYAYDGKAKEPAVTVTLDGKTLVKDTDYTVAYAKNTDPGTATVTVTGTGNYKDSASATFAITESAAATVNVQAHVQNIGWQKTVTDGGIAGTEGKGLRMEALKLTLPSDLPYKGGISYSAHVQNIGWQGAVADGKVAGTEGKALRVEAIRVELTGELADHYDVYYQVHAQNYGWLGWAKNGASAGTEGKALRLEALRVKLVAKGEAAPGSTDGAFVTSSGQVTSGTPASEQLVSYATHVQNIGWQVSNGDGGIAGTTGQSLRMEAVTLKLGDDIDGGIRYKAHIQNKGWESGWTADGKPSGTSGEALRLEAIQVELTGAAADNYDVYYRVHCQNIGWMGWAKNGESAGSEGYAYRLEALQVKLVPKDAAAPKADPASATNAAFQKK